MEQMLRRGAQDIALDDDSAFRKFSEAVRTAARATAARARETGADHHHHRENARARACGKHLHAKAHAMRV